MSASSSPQLEIPRNGLGGSITKGPIMSAVVLLSGGMDSAVALYWAAKTFHLGTVYGLFIDYHQRAAFAEQRAASAVWAACQSQYPNLKDYLNVVNIPTVGGLFVSQSSIQGKSEVNQYKDVQEAVEKTSTDNAYMPLRNAVFITIAAHHLLVYDKRGGHVIVGTRSRPDGPGGYADCTNEFSDKMTMALTQGADRPVTVVSPLNSFAPSRAKTIQLAQGLKGCFDALRHTVSCFHGTRCGHCLPCLRRQQAFEAVGVTDPAST